MLTGIFSTLLLPETNRQSLEDLSNEEQDGFVKGQYTCFVRFSDLVDTPFLLKLPADGQSLLTFNSFTNSRLFAPSHDLHRLGRTISSHRRFSAYPYLFSFMQ